MSLRDTLRQNSVPFEVLSASSDLELTGDQYFSGQVNLDEEKVLETTANSSTRFMAIGTAAYQTLDAEHPGEYNGQVLANGDALGRGTGTIDMKKDETQKDGQERGVADKALDAVQEVGMVLGGKNVSDAEREVNAQRQEETRTQEQWQINQRLIAMFRKGNTNS